MSWKKWLVVSLVVLAFLIPVMTAVVVTKDAWVLCGLVPLLACFMTNGAYRDEFLNRGLMAAVMTLVVGILAAVAVVVTLNSATMWFTVLMFFIFLLVYEAT